jgi:hypothetical protein
MKLIAKSVLFLAVLCMISACASQKRVSTPLALAAFNKNDVEVSIQLESNANGDYFLSATFAPLEGFHMYSKDIPLTGVDGLGRPTLIELTTESHMKSIGEMIESVQAEVPNFEPRELLVYPPGAVTLSLPVELPPGNEWVEDVVKVTYMSCSDHGCKAPVVGELVSIRVPGANMLIMGDKDE